MTVITMRRTHYDPLSLCEHAGLYLQRGFESWNLGSATGREPGSDENHNRDIAEHHERAATIVPDVYSQAYERWKTHLVEQGNHCGHWFGDLIGRLYLGLGEVSPLEAGITLHHTYGVPFIPGSAIKGVLHHYATTYGSGDELEALKHTVFGMEPDPNNDNPGNAGYVVFNDAWWVPGNGKPLTPEVVTVHHQEYYSSGGETSATDFDDPNPNSQIAIQGSFHFSFLAHESLHEVVKQLLEAALRHAGIGAKTSSGYGLFTKSETLESRFTQMKNQYQLDHSSPEQQVELMIEQASLDDLPLKLGKGRNKTAREVGEAYWGRFIAGLMERFGDDVADWEKNGNSNQKKTYKALNGEWIPNWEEIK